MEPNGAPPQILNLKIFPSHRRKVLSFQKFWALMERWKVPTDYALLVGHSGQRSRLTETANGPKLGLSDNQTPSHYHSSEADFARMVAGTDRRRKRSAPRQYPAETPRWTRWAYVILHGLLQRSDP